VPNDVGGFVYLPKMAAMVVLCNSLAPSNQYTTSLDSNSYLIHPVEVLAQFATFYLSTLILDRVQVFYNAVTPSWDPQSLPPYTVPGFDPGQDRFPIQNDVDPGQCAGMTYYAAWYWEQHSSSIRLVHRYDLGEARAIASEAQNLVKGIWPCTFWDNEQRDIYDTVEQMRRTHRPVPVGLRRETHSVEGERFAYHAVLAYSWTGTRLLCLDPNSAMMCPLAAPRSAEIYSFGEDNWACTGSNGLTIYEGVSKVGPVEKYSAKLNNIYNKYSDLSVEITLDDITNDAGESGLFYPGDRVVLDFNIRVRGHGIYVLAYPVTASLNTDHSSIIAASGGPDPVYVNAKVGDNHIKWSLTIPEDASPGEYDVLAKVYSNGVCDDEILRDVTGNGPNSGVQSGMWIPAFEVIEVLPDITGTWISTITGEQHYERWAPPDGDKAEDVTHRIEQQEWIPFVITAAETDKVTGYLLNGAEKTPIVSGSFVDTTLQIVLHRDWEDSGSTGYKHLEFRLALDQETGILQGQGSAIAELDLPAGRDRTTINIEDITLRRN